MEAPDSGFRSDAISRDVARHYLNPETIAEMCCCQQNGGLQRCRALSRNLLCNQAIGRDLSEVLRVAISSPRPLQIESGALRGGKAEGVLACLDGTAIPVEETSTMIRDDRGRVIGSVIAIREIAPR